MSRWGRRWSTMPTQTYPKLIDDFVIAVFDRWLPTRKVKWKMALNGLHR